MNIQQERKEIGRRKKQQYEKLEKQKAQER